MKNLVKLMLVLVITSCSIQKEVFISKSLVYFAVLDKDTSYKSISLYSEGKYFDIYNWMGLITYDIYCDGRGKLDLDTIETHLSKNKYLYYDISTSPYAITGNNIKLYVDINEKYPYKRIINAYNVQAKFVQLNDICKNFTQKTLIRTPFITYNGYDSVYTLNDSQLKYFNLKEIQIDDINLK